MSNIIKPEEFNMTEYIKTLSISDKTEFMKELGSQLHKDDMTIIKVNYSKKLKTELLLKFRKRWITLRFPDPEDDGSEWVSIFWKNNKMIEKNEIYIDYDDIILNYENDCWCAMTGTECEWFEEQHSLQAILAEINEHNCNNASTVGKGHKCVDRIFIYMKDLKYFETLENIEILHKRYKTVYLIDNSVFLK